MEDGTESKEKAGYFRLEWSLGGYRLNGLNMREVEQLELRKKVYMTSRGYPEDGGFVRATHRLEGTNRMLLED